MRNHEPVQRFREHARSSLTGYRIAALALAFVALASISTSRFGAGSPAAAPTPPSVRSASTAQNNAASSSLSLFKPSGVASGDVLVATVAARLAATAALSQPSGWTLVRRDDCSGPQRSDLAQAVFYKVAGGSEPSSYSFSFGSATGAAGSVVAYTGVNTASPVDGSSGRYSRNSVYIHGPSVTPSGEGTRAVGSFANTGAQAVTPPSGTSTRGAVVASASPSLTLTVVDQALASSDPSGNMVAKAEAPQSCNVGGVVILRPSGSPSSPPPPSPPPPSPPPPSPPPPSPPPPSPPPPSPPPSGKQIIQTGQWTCNGPVDLDLVKITSTNGSADALRLGAGCTGTIRRIELEGPMADGIKIQNGSSNAAHDLVIGGGYVSCGPAAAGVHQDGMQGMGGRNVVFRNLVIDCLGGGGGNFFPAKGGSGATTPTNIVCEHCALGPKHPNNVQIQESVNSGIRNSLICRPQSGRDAVQIGPNTPGAVNTNNLVVPSSDARCTAQGLRNWAASG